MGDVRSCEQCGASFEPRREHARFCSARCRRAWNRDKLGDPAPDRSALGWSVTAMRDTAELLAVSGPGPEARALTVIGEMVWWITIVDATLVRYHPEPYDDVLAARSPAWRRRTEGTLGGLRFVRNRMRGDAGCGEFIRASASPVTAWTWEPAPEPPLGSLPPRGRTWELTRYRAYQTHLAGRAVGEVFGLAEGFLERAALAAGLGAEDVTPMRDRPSSAGAGS